MIAVRPKPAPALVGAPREHGASLHQPTRAPSPHRCRLCTANDMDALVEEIAATMWESRRDGVMESRVWADAGEYWQKPFREMARGVAESLRG